MKATMRPVYPAFPNCDALRHKLSCPRYTALTLPKLSTAVREMGGGGVPTLWENAA